MMSDATEKLRQKLPGLLKKGTERTLYKPLGNWLEELVAAEPFKLRGVEITAEESAPESEVGFPDLTVRHGGEIAGWIEVKLPDKPLNHKDYEQQFTKYRDSLENVIFTNLREWELWQWDREHNEKPKCMKKALFDLQQEGDAEDFFDLLSIFFEYTPTLARTPKQLALALARKAKFLSSQVEEALIAAIKSKDKEHELVRLRATFEKTLIADISDHQFANMVAETLAYSLFLACLEHDERGNGTELTLTNAVDYLPKNVPILSDLFGLITRIAKKIPNAHHAAIALLEQLNRADIHRIRQKLVEHKPGEDPVIQFYEPFLAEYDPKEREARGVYYTPKPVVDFIVRGVDHIVRTAFSKEQGLADKSVNILDPATGTGTFLMSAIQQIYWSVKQKNEALGDEMVQREFNQIVQDHILKNFYGFELLIAPYAIAHLKLTLEIERLGFNFKMTEDDDDPDNDRFKVYLANTLDDPERSPKALFGFDAIPGESEKAQNVKKKMPILAIIGNPPYSGISQNPVEMIHSVMNEKTGKMKNKKVKTWIGDLIEDYKYIEGDRSTGKHFKEKKHWLGDDYVKFIRFAQWKIAQAGEGMIAMITNNGFLDNPTFRGMRYQLMQEFDEIYCLNLHGSTTKSDTTPDGDKDESVFNIQTGTSITFFVKKSKKQKCKVFYAEMFGLKAAKFSYLLETSFEKVEWKELEPNSPHYFFVKKNFSGSEYFEFTSVDKIFSVHGIPLMTGRDAFSILNSKEDLIRFMKEASNTDPENLRKKYDLGKDTTNWSLRKALSELRLHGIKDEYIHEINFRIFDLKHTYYTGKSSGVHSRPQHKVNQHMKSPNIGLLAPRQLAGRDFYHVFCSNGITEMCLFSNKTKEANQLFPLYLYPETTQTNLLGKTDKEPNLNPEFLKEFSKKLGRTPTPEEIFYYTYAVFHSPTYRTRYAEQLKIDFPRLPLISSKELFKALVKHGNALVNLHLLGENPFDDSKTIFDEPKKWNVKIGGSQPKGVEDWKVSGVEYDEEKRRVYVNEGQYFEGVEKEVWEFMIGGYQVCEKWLKYRKKADRALSTDDLKHYMKIVVSLRETIRIMQEIDAVIEEHGGWPIS